MLVKNYRIHLNQHLFQGAIIRIESNLLHYLSIVLRFKNNQLVKVFNESNGEFSAKFNYTKKDAWLEIVEFIRQAHKSKYLHLGIALLKNTIISEVINQSTQLGATHITFLQTNYTQNHNLNISRCNKIAQEATEQCNRFDLPKIEGPIPLNNFLKYNFDLLLFANEKEQTQKISEIKNWPNRVGVLIGPEGGFSHEEANHIKSNAFSIKLSDNILRAEVAAICALSQISLLR